MEPKQFDPSVKEEWSCLFLETNMVFHGPSLLSWSVLGCFFVILHGQADWISEEVGCRDVHVVFLCLLVASSWHRFARLSGRKWLSSNFPASLQRISRTKVGFTRGNDVLTFLWQHLGVILVQRNRRKEELGVDSMRAFVAESSSAPVTYISNLRNLRLGIPACQSLRRDLEPAYRCWDKTSFSTHCSHK